MRVSIIREDNLVVVDGEAHAVNLENLPAHIHAIQWNGNINQGQLEYAGLVHPVTKAVVKLPNEPLSDFAPYQSYVDAWKAQKETAAAEATRLKAEAAAAEAARINALVDARLAEREAEQQATAQHLAEQPAADKRAEAEAAAAQTAALQQAAEQPAEAKTDAAG